MTKGARTSRAFAETLLRARKFTQLEAELDRWPLNQRGRLDYIQFRAEVLLEADRIEELEAHLDAVQTPDAAQLALVSLYRAAILAKRGDREAALRAATSAIPCGVPSVDAGLAHLRANCQIRLGHPDAARSNLRDAISFYETGADLRKVAQCLVTLGVCESRLCNFDMAISCFQQARETGIESGARNEQSLASMNLGGTYLILGHLESAVPELNRARGVARELGAHLRVSMSEAALGLAYLRKSNPRQALDCLTRAHSVARTHGLRRQLAAAYEYLAELRLAEGRFQRARRLLQRAIRIGSAIGDPEAQFEPQYRLAEAELGLKNPALARDLAVEARDDFSARGDRLEAAFASRVAAQALLCQEKWDEARSELEEVRTTLEELGEQFEIHRVRRLLEAIEAKAPVFDIRLVERTRLDLETPAAPAAEAAAPSAPSSDGALAAPRTPSTTFAASANDSAEQLTIPTTSGTGASAHYSALICGRSQIFLDFLALVDVHAGGTTPILLEGETGVGKEVLARRIHANSPRKSGDFVPFNCGTSTSELFDSELFGYVRGAFTGARSSRRGLIRAAHQGTLLLDEIGELSNESQARLLRFLDTGEVRPVGSDSIEHADVRVVSATHRNLDQLVADGDFREDLLFRLNTVRLRVPPLRERIEDLELLVRHFLNVAATQGMGQVGSIRDSVLVQMSHHHWPGNIRELRNEILRLARQSAGKSVTYWAPGFVRARSEATAEISQEVLESALRQTNGSPTSAARMLSVHRMAVYRMVKRYGIDIKSFKN